MKTNGYHNHKLEESASLRKGKGKAGRTSLRLLSAALSLSMLLTGCGPASLTPLTTIPGGVEQIESALQDSTEDGEAKRTDTVITGFAGLPEDIRTQSVPLGTTIAGLTRPDTLEASVVVKDTENEGGGVTPPEDSEDDKESGDKGPGGTETPGENGEDGTPENGNDGTGTPGENGDGTPENGEGGTKEPGGETGDNGNPDNGNGGAENPGGGNGDAGTIWSHRFPFHW